MGAHVALRSASVVSCFLAVYAPITVLACSGISCIVRSAQAQGCTRGLAGSRTYRVGDDLEGFAVADFNGDGDVDIAVADQGLDRAAILLGTGDGTFTPGTPITSLTWARSVASADFDGDGKADLAVGAYVLSNLYVMRGNGDGTFQPSMLITVGDSPIAIATGDLNGDGRLDLVTADDQGNTVSVVLGAPGGGFQPTMSFPAGSRPDALALADFSHDGILDVVVSDRLGNAVSLMVGNGNGTFQAPTLFTVGDNPTGLVVGLFNGDAYPDVAVAFMGSGPGGGVTVLFGTASGLLQAGPRFGASDGASGLTASDLDGDGRIDLAVEWDGAGLEILRGDGTGAFQAGASYKTPNGHVDSSDLDRDGAVDLVLTGSYGTHTLATLSGLGDGTFDAAAQYDLGDITWSVASADFDLDGYRDLAVTSFDDVIILRGTAAGAFVKGGTYQGGWDSTKVLAGDWNRDGLPDLVTTNQLAAFSYLEGNGDGSFQPPVDVGNGTTPQSVALASADVNRDGADDIVDARSDGSVAVFLGAGGGFSPIPVVSPMGGAPSDLVVRDWSGDGVPDLATTRSATNDVAVALGNGDGSFQSGTPYAVGRYPNAIASADFDEDGNLDLAVAGSDGVSLLRGYGNGSFQTPSSIVVAPAAYVIAIGDFNGDRHADIALAHQSTQDVSILEGAGNGAFPIASSYVASFNALSLLAADFNGDGASDLAVPDRYGYVMFVLLSQGVRVTPTALPSGSVGAAYNQLLTASGGTAPYTFAVTAGALPTGLVLSPAGLLSGTPTVAATFGFTVAATDAAGCIGSRAYALDVTGSTGTRANLLCGEGRGLPNPNRVRAYRQDGSATPVDFLAYGAGKWGVNVAAGVVNGPGSSQILTGPGPGAVFGPQARGFLRDGTPLGKVSFYAYGTLRYGVGVGAGDVDGDGYDEIVTGAGPGAVFGPHVRGFDVDGGAATAIAKVSYFAYGTLKYGVNAQSGDVEGDGYDELLTGPGPGNGFGPQVRGFNYDGASLAAIGKINFNAFGIPRYGTEVAGGDVEGDGFDEMACAPGAGPGMPPRFVGFGYDGIGIAALPGFDVTTAPTSYGGRVGLGDVSGDGAWELIAGGGRDTAADGTVRPYLYPGASLVPLYAFDAFPGARYGVDAVGAALGF